MTKNKLSDLNDHLFAQLERLDDEDLKDEKLKEEIERSKSITHVAQTIINNAQLILDAKKHHDEYNGGRGDLPAILQIEDKSDKKD